MEDIAKCKSQLFLVELLAKWGIFLLLVDVFFVLGRIQKTIHSDGKTVEVRKSVCCKKRKGLDLIKVIIQHSIGVLPTC